MHKRRNTQLSSNLIPQERIESKILLIRGKKVMLDRDLANLYGVETRTLKQAVRRNIERFPEDFMFKLTSNEKKQVITICDNPNNIKFAPTNPMKINQAIMMIWIIKIPPLFDRKEYAIDRRKIYSIVIVSTACHLHL